MGKVILDMSMSLDGYIAKPNGDDGGLHHWVFGGDYLFDAGGMTFGLNSEKSATVFKEFVMQAGAFIVGKRTFIAGGEIASFQLPTFVLTNTSRVSDTPLITFVADDIKHILEQAKAVANGKTVYIGGGANVAQQYLKAGLVDELHINLIPVLFGDGIRLLDDIGSKIHELEVISVTNGEGVIHLQYRIVN